MAARQALSNIFGAIGNDQLKKGIEKEKKEEVQSTETNPLLAATKIGKTGCTISG